jgi:hypothetical protein
VPKCNLVFKGTTTGSNIKQYDHLLIFEFVSKTDGLTDSLFHYFKVFDDSFENIKKRYGKEGLGSIDFIPLETSSSEKPAQQSAPKEESEIERTVRHLAKEFANMKATSSDNALRLDRLEGIAIRAEAVGEENANRLDRAEAVGEENANRLDQAEAVGEENANRLDRVEAVGEENANRLDRVEAVGEENANRLDRVEAVADHNRRRLHTVEGTVAVFAPVLDQVLKKVTSLEDMQRETLQKVGELLKNRTPRSKPVGLAPPTPRDAPAKKENKPKEAARLFSDRKPDEDEESL